MKYPKINSLFKRDMSVSGHPLVFGDWSEPEFEYLKNNAWVFTEKVDGTNIRVYSGPETLRFGGRTEKAEIPKALRSKLDGLFMPLADKLSEMFPDGVILYGEGYGGKIQNGSKYLAEEDFVLFDVRVGSWWLTRDAVDDIAVKLGIRSVPIVGNGTLSAAVDLVRGGFKSTWGDFEAEGVVATPEANLLSRAGRRIITKLKCCDKWKGDCGDQ